MPFIPGASGLKDIYSSTNVFANNVPIALWLAPLPSPNSAVSESVLVNLSIEQVTATAVSGAAATSAEEREVGLSGRGEVPQEGPLETATPDPRGPLSSDLFTALGQTIDSCLAEAKQGKWKETGSNQLIITCYNSVGFNLKDDKTPWCAAFAGNILKRVGLPALKTLSSLAYGTYGTDVPIADPSKFRLNDIVILTRNGGGHIGFFRGYNPSTGSLLIAGGNQSDSLTEVGFKKSPSMPLSKVRRSWSIPPEYDKPVTYSGTGSSIKVV
jgi:uncharacterized protein (TIGR02594 family)